MSLEYSCFISYRHTKYKQAGSYTDQIVEALKGELELRVNHEVFRDVERLRGGEFYNEAVAKNLCRSACMIVLYCPTYFSQAHTYCCREYKGMEQLERQRLASISKNKLPTSGLIIVLAMLGIKTLPKEISDYRVCLDFERYTLRGSLARNFEFKSEIRKIGEYISDLYRMFGSVSEAGNIFEGCNGFTLPSESEVMPWLRKIEPPGSTFPTRRKSGED